MADRPAPRLADSVVCDSRPLYTTTSIHGVFHSLLSAIGFQSCFFFTADVSPPIRSTHSLTHFLGEFSGLGLALVPDVVVPEVELRCAGSRKLDPHFCHGRQRRPSPSETMMHFPPVSDFPSVFENI